MQRGSPPLYGISKRVTGKTRPPYAADIKKKTWNLSTTEVLCTRVHSWQSALECYEFLRKRHLPIADEAIMSLLLRIQDASKSCNNEINNNHQINNNNNNSDSPLHNFVSPLTFFLHSTQHQPTLRPLYHRIRFVMRDGQNSSRNAFLDLLPILSSPCAVINISLHHNLRKKRWDDMIRTIHNLHLYSLTHPYIQELQKIHTRSGLKSLLNTVNRDMYYKTCVEPPSLVPLMNELLCRWEEYWDILQRVTNTQYIFSNSVSSSSPSVRTTIISEGERNVNTQKENDEKSSAEEDTCHETIMNPFLVISDLQKTCLEILHFALLTTSYREFKEEEEEEEFEIFHRLLEATTRVADFSFCRQVLLKWRSSWETREASGKRHSIIFPSISTEQLLVTRLVQRAPSCEITIMKILDEWEHFAHRRQFPTHSHIEHDDVDVDDMRIVSRMLRCPEVVFALSTRLPPFFFFEEIVKKRLSSFTVLHERCVRGIVREALQRGKLYDETEKYWICQAKLEVSRLCSYIEEKEDQSHVNDMLVFLLREYLSEKLSVGEKRKFISDLLHHVGKERYAAVVDAVCGLTASGEEEENKNTMNIISKSPSSSISLLLHIIEIWITESHKLGDAAVLLRHTVHALEKKKPKPLECNLNESGKPMDDSSVNSFEWTSHEVITLFSEAVTRLEFLTNDISAHNDEEEKKEKEIKTRALEWLHLLSNIPSIFFTEQTLVVWLFWTMRAIIQWEEEEKEKEAMHSNSSISSLHVYKMTRENVIAAVRNLSVSLENCKEDAIFPPMLLNWLVSHTAMPWTDATTCIGNHAGKETCQKRRFLLLRLPLGHNSNNNDNSNNFDSPFSDAQTRRKLLWTIETELKENVSHKRGSYSRCIQNKDEEGQKMEIKVEQLFIAIRHTLLREWHTRALYPYSTEDMMNRISNNTFLPDYGSTPFYKTQQFFQKRHLTRKDVIQYTLKEILHYLVDEVPLEQKSERHEEI